MDIVRVHRMSQQTGDGSVGICRFTATQQPGSAARLLSSVSFAERPMYQRDRRQTLQTGNNCTIYLLLIIY